MRRLLVLGALLVALYLLRQPLFGSFVADRVSRVLSEALGVPVRVEAVLGSWVADARVERISIDRTRATGTLARLDAESLEVHFSLWELLRGEVAEGIRSVEAQGLAIELDFTRPAPEGRPDASGDADAADLGQVVEAVPRTFPPIDIDATVTVISDIGRFVVRDVKITTPEPTIMALDAEVVELPAPVGAARGFSARIRRASNGLVWESHSEIAGIVLERVEVGEGGGLQIDGELAGARLSVTTSKTTARLETGTMQVAQAPPWVLGLIDEPLLRPRSGGIELLVTAPRLNPIDASVRLVAKDLVLPRATIDALRLDARLQGERLGVSTVEVEAKDAQLSLRDLQVEFTDKGIVPRGLGALDLATDDLGRFISGLDRRISLRVQGHSPAGRELRISTLALRGEGLEVDGEARIDLEAASEDGTAARLDARVAGYAADLAVGAYAVDGRLDFAIQVGGTLADPRFAGSVRGRDLAVEGVRIARLDLEGQQTKGGVAISTLRLESVAGRVEGAGRIALEPLRFEDVALRLDVDDLAALRRVVPGRDVPVLAGALSGDLAVRGALEALGGRADLRFTDLGFDGADLGSGRIVATAEDGRVTIDALDLTGTWGAVEMTGRANLGAREGTIATAAGRVGPHPFRLQAPVRIDASEGLRVSGLDLEAFGGRIQGSAQWSPARAGRLAFRDLDVAALRALDADIPDVGGRASGEIGLGPEGLRLDLSIPELRFEAHRGRLALSLREAGDVTVLDRLAVDAGDLLVAEGSGRLPFRLRDGRLVATHVGDAAFELSLRSGRVQALADLPFGTAAVTISGAGEDIDLRLDVTEVEALAGLDPLKRMQARLVSGPVGSRLEVTLEEDPRAQARLDLSSPMGWRWVDPREIPDRLEDVVVDGTLALDVPDAATLLPLLPDGVRGLGGALRARLSIAGALPHPELTGDVEGRDLRVQLRDVDGAVRVPALALVLSDGTARLREATLQYGSASVRVEGRLDVPKAYDRGWQLQAIDGRARFEIPDLAVLNDVLHAVEPLGGNIEGDLRVRGTLQQPRLGGGLQGRGVALRVPGRAERFQVPRLELAFDDRTATLRALRLECEGAHVDATGTLTWPAGRGFDLDAIQADLDVKGRVPDLRAVRDSLPALPPLEGRVAVDLKVEGPLRSPAVHGRLEARALRMPIEGLATPLAADALVLRLDRDRIVVEEGVVALGGARARILGWVGRPATLGGDWLAQPLALRVETQVPDLTFLRAFNDEDARLSGGLEGAVDVGGRVSDPDVTGAIDLRGVGGALPGSLPTITGLQGRLAFRGRRVDIEGLRGAFGHGPFEISGSALWPDGSEPRLDVAVRGQRVLLVRDDDIRFRADLDLTVVGPWSALETRGDARIADLLVVASMDVLGGGGPASASDGFELFTLDDPPLDSMRFDVHVRAADTIRFRTNVLKGNASADVQLRGTGRAPAPEGRISFPGMLVKLPFSSLQVESGSLTFPPGQTTQPQLRAMAETQMKGFELRVLATGALPDVSVRVSSVPPLSQSEAILLLSTGATSEQLREEGLTRAALTRIGTFFGQSVLSGGGRGPEDPDEKGFFDRFTFEIGREVSRSGRDTMAVDVHLRDRFYLRGERDRYDDFNAGLLWQWRFK